MHQKTKRENEYKYSANESYMNIFGTKQAIQAALAYAYTADTSMSEYLDYLCSIDKTRKTGIEQNVMAIHFAKIRAAINDQKAPIPQWIHFAYGPDLEHTNKPAQKRTLSLMLARKLNNPGPISLKRQERLEKLCMVAAEDYRLGLFMGARGDVDKDEDRPKKIPVVVYCQVMGVLEENFSRDWARIREKVLRIIKNVDSNGIIKVSKTVREIWEAESA